MNIWFTSDHHFGHKNIIKYAKRPFYTVAQMDRTLIENWNDCVQDTDIVYYVGDFTLSDFYIARDYFAELNGKIFVLDGSHDRWIHQRRGEDLYAKEFKVQILSPLESVYGNHPDLQREKGELPIVLCHYAMRSWDRSHYGSWHLFGHHHGSLEPYGLSFDVGVDTNDFSPYSLDDVARKMATLEPIIDYSKRR